MDRKALVNQSMDYIMKHLDDALSLDAVADHFFISKYHFSRIFKEETGESVYAFIKRCRVDQSAVDMKLNPDRTITDIGLDYGYDASNYSAVFRKLHNTSPSGFRQSIPTDSMPVPFTPERIARFMSAEEYGKNIELLYFDDFFVLYERFVGDYIHLEKNWYAFIDKNMAFYNDNTVLVERFYNDPTITNADQCICDICMTVDPDCEMKNVMKIEGGKWLVYHYSGAIGDIFETVQGVFNVWLPQSGYKMTRRYGLNIYREVDRENHKIVMDLCIPAD